ncbi:MAG: macro domain-containing protein [archaeon]
MPIKYQTGDLLLTHADVIAHGVAAYGIEDMATGVAKQLNEAMPESYKEFKKLRRKGFKPGEVVLCTNTFPYVAYLATQPDLYHAELPFVNHALRGLRKLLEKEGMDSCALPKIGCGYGKLDWGKVQPIIEERLSDSSVEFTIYDIGDATKK